MRRAHERLSAPANGLARAGVSFSNGLPETFCVIDEVGIEPLSTTCRLCRARVKPRLAVSLSNPHDRLPTAAK